MSEALLWTVIVVVVVLALVAVVGARVTRSRRQLPEDVPTVAEALTPPPRPSGASRAPSTQADLRTPNRTEPNDGVRPGPYPGSALPDPDGSAPSGQFVVKADKATKRYYTPGFADYQRLRADLWFANAGDADAAGFRPVHQ